MNKNLYQTLEDRGNPREVEHHGPYECTRRDAWLGDGFYFWDSFINLARSWGEKSYHGRYMICLMVFPYIRKKIFDLTGEDAEQLNDFRSYYKEFKKSGKKYTVPGVIEHMKRHAGLADDYIAIRARDSRQSGPRIFFRDFFPEYLELEPRIQICFFSNAPLAGIKYKIIHPKKYMIEDQFI